MDAFEVHRRLISDYQAFKEGFVSPRQARVAEVVADESARGAQWPDPWLSLNPSFAGEYRTKRAILEMYDAMAEAMRAGTAYESPISPPPGEGPRHPQRSTP